MLIKLKKWLFNTDEKRRLISNVFSLGMLQIVNYILPFISIPYLVKVLGPECFGLIAFSAAVIGYFVLLTDYGFNLSATKKISIYRYDREKLNQIFSSVMIIKVFLTCISFLILVAFLTFMGKSDLEWKLYIVTFGLVLGQVIFPVWLFRGLEEMKFIAALNLVSKVICTICIFIYVKDQSDYLIAPLITSLGSIFPGILAIIIVRKKFDIRFNFQKLSLIKEQVDDGYHVFTSTLAISAYTLSTTVILGLLTNNQVVGYFSAADKIIQAAKSLYQPISYAMYPAISLMVSSDKKRGLAWLTKIGCLVSVGMFIVSVCIFLFSRQIIILFYGKEYLDSVILLKTMSFLPFIISISNMLGVQTMLTLGYAKEFFKILLIAAILGLFLNVNLVSRYNAFGASLALLLVESFVTIAMLFFIKKKLFNKST